MTRKIECKEFPKAIRKCIKKPHVDVIKTRKNGKDTYIYEVTAEGVPSFVLDPEHTIDAGGYPDLEDTWCGGQWPGEKYNGCDYDINIFDKSVYGDDTDECGLSASICSCYQDGDYPVTDSDDCVKATVTCWFQDEKGKRIQFKCSDGEHFIERFGEWDGQSIPDSTGKKTFYTVGYCHSGIPASLEQAFDTQDDAAKAIASEVNARYREHGMKNRVKPRDCMLGFRVLVRPHLSWHYRIFPHTLP